MTPAQLARTAIRRTLEEIAHNGDGERLRGLLRGRELPALGSGKEPATQIIEALNFPPYGTGLSHDISHLWVVRQFGRMCIRMVRFCRFADALRMLG